MKIFQFIILINLTIIFSCSQPTKQEKKQETVSSEKKDVKSPDNVLGYQIKFLQQKDNPCPNNQCTTVKVGYPKFSEESNASKSLNDAIEKKAAELLSDYITEADPKTDISKLMNKFIENYNMFKATFPEAKTNWYVNINAKPTLRSKDFVSLRFEIDSYTGGAHNVLETLFVNFNSRGKELEKLSHFFRDKQSIRKIAEAEFRKSQGLKENQSLSEAGFVFENDKFQLSDNFGFNNNQLVFYYNSYEIATYSDGPTEIVIPLKSLKDNYRF